MSKAIGIRLGGMSDGRARAVAGSLRSKLAATRGRCEDRASCWRKQAPEMPQNADGWNRVAAEEEESASRYAYAAEHVTVEEVAG